MMIIHIPWVGERYKEGVGGHRLAIVGHSNYSDTDFEELTIYTMGKMLEEGNLKFY